MGFCQPTAQKGGHMLLPMGEETFVLISNAPKKGGAPSYLQQKQAKIQQKPRSYDKGPTPQIGN
jgi:hypothetical protein